MDESNITNVPELILGKILQYCGHGQIMGMYNASHSLRVRIRRSQFFPIYPNQISAAEEVVHNFKKGTRYGVITAETQSGKTGTCQAICYLVRDIGKELGIENYYFLCGMNDNNLKSQQVREFDGLIDPANILFSKDMQFFGTRKWVKKWQLESAGFDKFFKNTLIFIDESHYAQNMTSMVHKFMTQYAGLTMDGDAEKWAGTNLYCVSISATPLSEMIHLLKKDQPKALVRLKPGPGYYGFKRMFELGRVFEAKGFVRPEDRTNFVNVLRDMYSVQEYTGQYKYALIRFSNSGHGDEYRTAMQGLIDFPVSYIHFHSETMDIKHINKILDTPPTQFTIIEVYHSLRAGIQMKTDNVCLVYETAKAKTDSTVQGLPGRCTGYNKEKDNVLVFCHKKFLLNYVKLIESDFDPSFTPNGGNNVKKGHSKDPDSMFTSCIPVGARLDNELLDELIQLKAKSSQYGGKFQKQGLLSKILKRCGFDPLDGCFVGVSLLDEKNKTTTTGTWTKFWDPAYKAFTKKQKGSYFRSVKLPDGYKMYFYIYVNLKKDHDQYGWALVTSKQRFDPDKEDTYLKTTGKEQFHSKNNENLFDLVVAEQEASEEAPVLRLKKKEPIKLNFTFKKKEPKKLNFTFKKKSEFKIKLIGKLSETH